MVIANHRPMLLPFECWKHTRSHLKTRNQRKFLFYILTDFNFAFNSGVVFCCGPMAERKQYSLRSGNAAVTHVPIHIQSAGDTAFLSMLQNQQTGTDDSSDNTSEGEQNGEVEVGQPGTEQTVSSENTGNISDSSNAAGSSVLGGNTQQVINLQILHQLGNIGKRLHAIESKGKNKTTDLSKIKGKSAKSSAIDTPVTLPAQQSLVLPLPNLQSLRSDALIQAQVEQRLRDLVDENKSGTKIKSLRGGSVDVVVPNRVKWPQEYVLSGSKKERVQYDNLSITQWMTGFCRIMKEENNMENKEYMLDYLIQLLEDANDFSWDAAKASHAVLLCRMEQGDVKNYTQVDKTDRIRRANAQRHVANFNQNVNQNAKNYQKHVKVTPCLYFNKGTCTHMKSHETKGITYKHICVACYTASGRTFPHPETECRNKNKRNIPKNE